MRKIAAVITIAVVAVAVPAMADVTKCQQGIDKNGSKLEASILKALTKCVDGYRKANGDPGVIGTAAISCQTGLNKVLDFGNDALITSAMEKTLLALDKLTITAPPVCGDTELSALGHLTSALFGQRWKRLILLASLKGAYETQQVLIADFPNIMQTFGDNGCGLCTALSTPPCLNSVCTLGVGSGAETKIGGSPVPVPLAGATIIAGCEWQKVLNDPAANLNEIGLIGTPNLGFKPSLVIDLPGTDTDIYACNVAYRSMGILACAGASNAPKVSYTTCQDSLIEGGVDECEAGADSCQADPEATTGGACADFTPAAAADGDTFVISTTRLRISTNDGPDNIRCNADDTLTTTAPAPIPATTGTVTATVIDYGNTNGNNQSEGPIAGATGPNCAQARVGNSAGRTLVGAFPAAEAVPAPPGSLGDTVTKLTLVCN